MNLKIDASDPVFELARKLITQQGFHGRLIDMKPMLNVKGGYYFKLVDEKMMGQFQLNANFEEIKLMWIRPRNKTVRFSQN